MERSPTMDYKKAYKILFNTITDAIEKLDSSEVITRELYDGSAILRKAQQTTEEMYMDSENIMTTPNK